MFQLVGTASARCIDELMSSTVDGAPLFIFNCTGGSNQLFRFVDAGAGASSVVNVNSGKCLDFASATLGAPLTQRTCTGAANQAFIRRADAGTAFNFVNVGSGLCIDVTNANNGDGSAIQQWSCNGGSNQSWRLQANSTGSCVPESDRTFCTRVGSACDVTTGIDNCGSTRTVTCGPCIPLQQACGVASPNACSDIGKINLAQGGTVTASSAGTAPTDMTMAFDGDATTKWLAPRTTAWIAYAFAGLTPALVTSYTITSPVDWPDTDPSSWTLDGSNDGTAWTTLDTRTGQTFASRQQTNLYSFANATPYNRYRVNVTSNNGSGNNIHIAEIQLFR
jgi:hypothetical protein